MKSKKISLSILFLLCIVLPLVSCIKNTNELKLYAEDTEGVALQSLPCPTEDGYKLNTSTEDAFASKSDPTVFTTTIRINDYMPELTFYRKLGSYISEPGFFNNERYISIIIVDDEDNLIQEIDEIIQGGMADG